MCPHMNPGSRRLWPWILVVLLASSVYFASWFQVTTGDLRPEGGAADVYGLRFRDDVNVLFILIDTLRADRLGTYGYERETSPSLDYLASTGVVFERHLAQSSWTKCSMASLWTGLYPARTGVTRFDHGLPESAIMPAETFLEAGFRTAGVWRNGWVAPNFGFGQGFEVYDRPRAGKVPPEIRRENPHVSVEGTDHDVVDNSIEFLRAHGHERWFLYAHLMDVHQYIYDEDSALFGSSYSDVYDNSIHHTDGVVGRLLNHLSETGLLEKTLVVITSDHGEAFGERGFEGHARNVDRETTEVPLILGFPFALEEGVRLDVRSANVDVWPTVFELLGLSPAEDLDGRSFAPDILAQLSAEGSVRPGPPRSEAVFAHLDRSWGQQSQPSRPTVAVVEDGFRYVFNRAPDGAVDAQLYDANSDPLERADVIATHPDRAEDLRAQAEIYLDESPPPPWGEGATSVEIDAMELNQLRALGYELP